ncbi:MAG: hypothetical protein WCY74_03675, partial [Sphaerochaetaceae bacterium]
MRKLNRDVIPIIACIEHQGTGNVGACEFANAGARHGKRAIRFQLGIRKDLGGKGLQESDVC